MASLLSPAAPAAAFHQDSKPIRFPPSRDSRPGFLWPLSNPCKKNPTKCNAFLNDISDNLLSGYYSLHLDQSFFRYPALQQLLRDAEELPDVQKWGLFIAGGIAWIYLTARPGVLFGAVDVYILAPLQVGLDTLSGRRSLKRTDFLVGGRIGEGSFDVVYSGVIVPKNVSVDENYRKKGSRRDVKLDEKFKDKVILKKVKLGVQGAVECGEFEEWFNYRLSRAAAETCAEFLGSFTADKTNNQFTKDNATDYYFPQEDSGIVHRDVKPSNLVVTKKGQIKLIDFGAATDLRIGKNYVPNRGLLDPDYCPPELYVMPEETPNPPPEPIAALLSPFLGQLNSPDLFDMYSAGIVLLQMATPTLRSSSGLKNFNIELKAVGYDLKRWREITRMRPDLRILDIDSGRGWDLARSLSRREASWDGGGYPLRLL